MMAFNKKRVLGIVIGVSLILMVPLVAMQVTDEVNWTLMDFGVAGALLLIFGFLLELIIQKVNKVNYRIVLFLGLLISLILIWMELAVGIF